jgi:spore coat protein U-like protein
MKKSNVAVSLTVAVLMGALLTPALSLAGTANQNMTVQAQVSANCNFASSNTMDFLSYDPADANATAPLGGSVAVTVRCTKGANVTIGIDTGAHAGAVAGSTRAMQFGTNYLGYDFYKDSTYTALWTNAGAGLYSFVSASNNPATVSAYGRVPGNQDVPAGTYTDTVVVWINY